MRSRYQIVKRKINFQNQFHIFHDLWVNLPLGLHFKCAASYIALYHYVLQNLCSRLNSILPGEINLIALTQGRCLVLIFIIGMQYKLTHLPWKLQFWSLTSNFLTRIKNRYLEHFLLYWSQVNATRSHSGWLVWVMAWCRQAICHHLDQCWPN